MFYECQSKEIIILDYTIHTERNINNKEHITITSVPYTFYSVTATHAKRIVAYVLQREASLPRF